MRGRSPGSRSRGSTRRCATRPTRTNRSGRCSATRARRSWKGRACTSRLRLRSWTPKASSTTTRCGTGSRRRWRRWPRRAPRRRLRGDLVDEVEVVEAHVVAERGDAAGHLRGVGASGVLHGFLVRREAGDRRVRVGAVTVPAEQEAHRLRTALLAAGPGELLADGTDLVVLRGLVLDHLHEFHGLPFAGVSVVQEFRDGPPASTGNPVRGAADRWGWGAGSARSRRRRARAARDRSSAPRLRRPAPPRTAHGRPRRWRARPARGDHGRRRWWPRLRRSAFALATARWRPPTPPRSSRGSCATGRRGARAPRPATRALRSRRAGHAAAR